MSASRHSRTSRADRRLLGSGRSFRIVRSPAPDPKQTFEWGRSGHGGYRIRNQLNLIWVEQRSRDASAAMPDSGRGFLGWVDRLRRNFGRVKESKKAHRGHPRGCRTAPASTPHSPVPGRGSFYFRDPSPPSDRRRSTNHFLGADLRFAADDPSCLPEVSPFGARDGPFPCSARLLSSWGMFCAESSIVCCDLDPPAVPTSILRLRSCRPGLGTLMVSTPSARGCQQGMGTIPFPIHRLVGATLRGGVVMDIHSVLTALHVPKDHPNWETDLLRQLDGAMGTQSHRRRTNEVLFAEPVQPMFVKPRIPSW